jgi:hypothetical protein
MNILSRYLGPLAAVVFALGSSSVALAAPKPLRKVPVVGTVNGDAFTGNLRIDRIETDGSQLVASGEVKGKISGINNSITQSFTNVPVALLDADDPGVCDLLFLDIQPITLDLLGLQLELSRITLDLDAVPGAGNLVGNLLCAVAGLFDGLDLGAILSGVLGNILEALNGLL